MKSAPRLHVALYWPRAADKGGPHRFMQRALALLAAGDFNKGLGPIEIVAEPLKTLRKIDEAAIAPMGKEIAAGWLAHKGEHFFPGYALWSREKGRFERVHHY